MCKDKLDAVYETLMAYDKGEVRQFNISVPSAVPHAMKLYKSFLHDKDRFVAIFRDDAFDVLAYDNLPTRVGALWHADILLNQAISPVADVAKLVEESKRLYKKLARAALYLWGDDGELAKVVASIRAGSGFMDQADDLARYAVLFTENWADAKGNCNVTLEDVEAARAYSVKILNAMTEKSDSSVSDLRDLRNRAGEYLRRAVDDIRDAALYVFRKDNDVNERYPSLFAGHIEKRRKNIKSQKDNENSAPDTETTIAKVENA